MASQIPIQSFPIKSTARKLPIKRKPVLNSPDPIKSPTPNPNPNPNPNYPIPPSYDNNFEDDESNSQDDEEEDGGGGDGDLTPPPFKFHRIWSESDEIRFLQGLLGCASQGLLFPRDLNIFYDRFSESMPQPYTLSQLSEKLRRLRRKFRILSGRIAGGQDPNRLAPHDRDMLHLCLRLWDPKFASGSPFSDAGRTVAAVGGSGNKRRRRSNPQQKAQDAPSNVLMIGNERHVEFDSEMKVGEETAAVVEEKPKLKPKPAPANVLMIGNERHVEFDSALKGSEEMAVVVEEKPKPAPTNVLMIGNETHVEFDSEMKGREEMAAVVEEKLKPVAAVNGAGDSVSKREDVGYVAVKTVLDVFDGSLKEIRDTLTSEASSCGSELAKRWQEQRVAELDVFARRLRLVLEQSLHN